MSGVYEKAITEEESFENFVSRVNKVISEDELGVMKQHVTGCFGEDLLDIQTFSQLIQALTRKNLLSSTNLAIIKKMFFQIGRKDLIELAIKYTSVKAQVNQRDLLIQDREGVSVTFRVEFLSYTDEHLQELVRKLSEMVFVPIDQIKVNRIEQLSSGGYVCVMEVAQVYAEILQDHLERRDGRTGLNLFGVTDILICDTAYKIKDKMAPIGMLQKYQKVVDFLNQQNQEFIQRLDQLGKSLESLQPLVAELGDPKTHLKNLENIHKYSGMSTTIWKVLGKFSNEQLPQKYKPNLSQEEIRQNCLYSKARLQRIYPHLTTHSGKKELDREGTSSLSDDLVREDTSSLNDEERYIE